MLLRVSQNIIYLHTIKYIICIIIKIKLNYPYMYVVSCYTIQVSYEFYVAYIISYDFYGLK